MEEETSGGGSGFSFERRHEKVRKMFGGRHCVNLIAWKGNIQHSAIEARAEKGHNAVPEAERMGTPPGRHDQHGTWAWSLDEP